MKAFCKWQSLWRSWLAVYQSSMLLCYSGELLLGKSCQRGTAIPRPRSRWGRGVMWLSPGQYTEWQWNTCPWSFFHFYSLYSLCFLCLPSEMLPARKILDGSFSSDDNDSLKIHVWVTLQSQAPSSSPSLTLYASEWNPYYIASEHICCYRSEHYIFIKNSFIFIEG